MALSDRSRNNEGDREVKKINNNFPLHFEHFINSLTIKFDTSNIKIQKKRIKSIR